MEKVKKEKKYIGKKIKIVLLIFCFILVAIVFFCQFYKPIVVTKSNIKCYTWDATYASVENVADEYKNGELNTNTTIVHSLNGNLPSKNPNDYFNIYWHIEMQNRSLLDNFMADAYVCEINDYQENVLFSSTACIAVVHRIDRIKKGTMTVILDVYKGDMNKEDIETLVKNIKIKVIFDGKFLGRKEQIISYKDGDNLEIE